MKKFEQKLLHVDHADYQVRTEALFNEGWLISSITPDGNCGCWLIMFREVESENNIDTLNC